MAPMLQAKQLAKSIGDKVILRSVTLELEAGEALSILGPNGAGKSTLLKIFSTLLKPSSGELWIDGKSAHEETAYCKQKIGFLPHQSLLYDHLTAWQNLVFYGNLYHIPQLEERVGMLLRKVGLYHFRDEPVRSFSRGMIQRLAIARAVLHQPSLLLLDEPHTGLDVEAIQLLNQFIRELKSEGCSVVMVTHDFEQALDVCDQICILKQGKIVNTHSTDGLATESLQEHYERQVVGC